VRRGGEWSDDRVSIQRSSKATIYRCSHLHVYTKTWYWRRGSSLRSSEFDRLDAFVGVDWCRMSRATSIYFVSSLSLAYGRRYVLSSWIDSGVGRHVNVRISGQSTEERTRGLQGQVSDDVSTEQQIGFLGEILSVLVPFFRCVVT
jgi:hypothetical protein